MIPASSIKGAVSHRLAFNFNKVLGRFSDIPGSGAKEADENEAVRALLGYEDKTLHMKGALLFSDIIVRRRLEDCSFNHIRIDSFTSAVIGGALFNEKAFCTDNENFDTSVLLCRSDFERNLSICGTEQYKERIIEALEMTFTDLCEGTLPLGGLVNKGFGRFTGSWKKEQR
ncbi:MAG: RAMP superfamily CRISPR-associated protein [Candidatus Cryptobacteroides sp.]